MSNIETFRYAVLPFGFYLLTSGDPESFFYLDGEPAPHVRRIFGRLFRMPDRFPQLCKVTKEKIK